MQVGHDLGKGARVQVGTEAARPESIGTMTSSTSPMCWVATCKPKAAAAQGQSGAEEGQSRAEEGWIEAGLVKAGAELIKTAAEQVWNAAVLAWSEAVWGSFAAKKVKTPAVPGYSRAEQDRAGAGEARIDCEMVMPLRGKR